MAAKTKASRLLSDVAIKSAKTKQEAYTLRDGAGLSVLIHPNGSKYFQLRYTLNGKARKTQLGIYPDISLATARELADNLLGKITTGIDPIVEKKKARAVAKADAEYTFEVVAQEWLTLKAKNVTESYHIKISGMIKANTYARLGKLPISSINSKMILDTLKVIELRGAIDLMHRVRALIAELFDYAKAMGLYKGDNPASALKNSVALAKHTPENYKTLRTNQDIGIFLRRLDEYDGRPETKLLIKLQMMVATRPSEMRTATWDEFDFDKAIWTIAAKRMKMGVEHIIPLPQQALNALYELKALTGYSKYLFPSTGKNGTLSEGTANKALKLIWKEYLIQPHGFRHLFSTHANENDHKNADIIEAALAHKSNDRIRATYNKATYINERKKLSQWYADYLDDLRDKSH